MRKFYLLILPVVFVFFSCAQIQVNNRLSELKETLDPLINIASKEDMVRMFGMPDRIENIGGSEFLHIRISYGMKGLGTSGSWLSTASAWERYDDITLEFRNGKLFSWRAYVQR